MLYAIDTNKGEIYWGHGVESQAKPVYKEKTIIVGDQVFNALTGKLID